jgi:hypothetical protein
LRQRIIRRFCDRDHIQDSPGSLFPIGRSPVPRFGPDSPAASEGHCRTTRATLTLWCGRRPADHTLWTFRPRLHGWGHFLYGTGRYVAGPGPFWWTIPRSESPRYRGPPMTLANMREDVSGLRMPTNLPDRRERKPNESEEALRRAILWMVGVAVVVTCGMIIWSFPALQWR